MKITMLLCLLTLLVSPLAALAEGEEAPKTVDQRQENQEKRIEQGVKAGDLTKHEAKRLEHQQKRIGKAEERAQSDGTVTKREAHHLHKMQNRASRAIHHQRHDRKRR